MINAITFKNTKNKPYYRICGKEADVEKCQKDVRISDVRMAGSRRFSK
jgi:hypothetical protein